MNRRIIEPSRRHAIECAVGPEPRRGARRGVLPWGQTRMADFSIVGELVENVIFLDLDEELA